MSCTVKSMPPVSSISARAASRIWPLRLTALARALLSDRFTARCCQVLSAVASSALAMGNGVLGCEGGDGPGGPGPAAYRRPFTAPATGRPAARPSGRRARLGGRSIRDTIVSSGTHRGDQRMTEFKFVSYETFDDGTIARILLNRPESRNAQSRDARRARRGVRAGRGGRPGARRHPRGRRQDVLLRPRHGVARSRSRSTARGRTSTRPARSTAAPASPSRTGCSRSGTTSTTTPAAGATCARSRSPRCTATSTPPA